MYIWNYYYVIFSYKKKENRVIEDVIIEDEVISVGPNPVWPWEDDHMEAKKGSWTDPSLTALRKVQPANTFISDFCSPDWDNKFLSF